jgi:hypothetical protein
MRTLGDHTTLLEQASTKGLEMKHRHKLRGKHGYGGEALPEQTGGCCGLVTLRTQGAGASQGTSSTTRAPSPAAFTGIPRLVRAA